MREIVLGNPVRINETLRMSLPVFNHLKQELSQYGLAPTRNMGTDEQLAIFLFTVSQSAKNWDSQERFQGSVETISRNDFLMSNL